MNYLPLVLLLPLARLIVEDFRRREVPVVWLAVLALGTVCIPLIMHGWHEAFTRGWQNLLLLACLGLAIFTFAWVREKRPVNPIDVYIGLGDVLFFLAFIAMFPAQRFAWLTVGSMAVSMVWTAAMRLLGKESKNVPLVATAGIVMTAGIVYNVFFE